MKNIIAFFSFLIFSSYTVAQNMPLQESGELLKGLEQCTKIESSLERLNCFDLIAGTPVNAIPASNIPGKNSFLARSQIMQLVLSNEEKRKSEEKSFLISESVEEGGGTQIILTTPALDLQDKRVYLSISCIFNITRLQLVTDSPVNKNVLNIKIFVDQRPVTGQTTWQVLQSGEVVDSGRGLPAIDLIRRFATSGRELHIQSDYAPFNGLRFDISALPDLIQRERTACHW